MIVSELIRELGNLNPNAEIITPGNHGKDMVFGITDIVECDPVKLSDGSGYPVYMLVTD